MRGSVKKGGRWYIKIELDADPGTGRRRQKWHSGFRTRREAERARVDLLSKFDRGEYVEPSHQTLGEFLTDWLRAIEPTVRPSTFDSYSRNLRLHVIAHIGPVRLTKVDAGVLNGLYATLLASARRPSSRKGVGYSPSVINRAQALRAEGHSLAQTAAQLRVAQGGSGAAGLDRRTVNYVHTILHRALKDAVRWGRCPAIPLMRPIRLGPARSRTAYMPGTRKRCVSSSTPRGSPKTGFTAFGSCSPRPACGGVRPSVSDGRRRPRRWPGQGRADHRSDRPCRLRR